MLSWVLPLLVALATPTRAAPAVHYGSLDRATCESELTRRNIQFTPVAEARGVLAPVRLTGPLHGVTYHSALPARQRATSPYDILDCRLVLALDDFSQILAKHDIVEVIHFSVYRPATSPVRRSRADGPRVQTLAHQHAGALAIDAGWFKKRDGTVLQVERDFHGRIGTKTCGPGTGPSPATPDARELRSIVCDAADARLFNVELTPDYNWPHRNHFHLEVTPQARWFLVH